MRNLRKGERGQRCPCRASLGKERRKVEGLRIKGRVLRKVMRLRVPTTIILRQYNRLVDSEKSRSERVPSSDSLHRVIDQEPSFQSFP